MLNIKLFQSAEGITLQGSALNGAIGQIRTGDGRSPGIDIKKYIEAKFAGFNTNVQVVSSHQIVGQVPANQYYIIYSALPDVNFPAANFTFFYNKLKAYNLGLATICLTSRRIAFIFTNEPINVRNTTIKFIGTMLGLQGSQFGFMGMVNPSNERWANSNVQTLRNKLTFSTKPLPFSESRQELYDGAWVMKLKRPTYSNFNAVGGDFDGVAYSGNLLDRKNIIGPRRSQFENPAEEDMDGIALFLEAGRYTVSCVATEPSYNMLAPKIYPYLGETTSIYNGSNLSIGTKCSQLNDNSKLNGEVCGPVNILLDGEIDNYSFTLKKNGFVTFGIKNRYIEPLTNDARLQSSYFGNYEFRITGTNIYNYNSSKFGSGKKDYIYSYPKPKCFGYFAPEIEFQPNRGKTLYDFIEQAKIDHPNDLVEYLNGQGYDLVYNSINGKLEPFLFNITEETAPLAGGGPLIATTYPIVVNGSLLNLKMIVREQDYTLNYMQFVVEEGGGIGGATTNGFWERTAEAVKKEFFVYSVSTSASTPGTTPTAAQTTLVQ